MMVDVICVHYGSRERDRPIKVSFVFHNLFALEMSFGVRVMQKFLAPPRS